MFTFSLETGSIKSAGICLKRTWFSVQNNTSSAVVCKPWQFQEVLTRSFWLISSFNLVIANFVYLMINCDRNAFQFHSSYFYHVSDHVFTIYNRYRCYLFLPYIASRKSEWTDVAHRAVCAIRRVVRIYRGIAHFHRQTLLSFTSVTSIGVQIRHNVINWFRWKRRVRDYLWMCYVIYTWCSQVDWMKYPLQIMGCRFR